MYLWLKCVMFSGLQERGKLIPPIKNIKFFLSAPSSWRYVFISQKAYQESETRPESSVYTVMKGSAVHGDQILDTVEYARPSEVSSKQSLHHETVSLLILWRHYYLYKTNVLFVAFHSQGGDVISTILRREVTYDQMQGTCAEVGGEHKVFFSMQETTV